MSTPSYDFGSIEARWQARWTAENTYAAERYPRGPTYFVLVFPPYPNGRIHMGHVRNYTIGDVVARYKRMCGASVLHPIGFDAFGLPNELEARKVGTEPEHLTRMNIERMTIQLRRLGYSYDWKSTITTLEPSYYKWNQWLFLTLHEKGLAYRKAASVQWCPSCKTSLANEQVREGRCWRCDTEVVARHLRQWFFRLRAYADEIGSEAAAGAFPENVGRMIQDWIGRTHGAELTFPVLGTTARVSVFTTKPELSYGATYLALSPEHPLVPSLVASAAVEEEVARLRERVQTTTEVAELTEGVDTGAKARHPLTGELIPIWVAAYVDPDFATGAVMGNPCHDRRDHVFGQRHGLAGRSVLSPAGSAWDYRERGPYLGDGLLKDSQAFTGRAALEARDDVMADWELRGIGKRVTVFAIRDWLISRQRAWGTPVPIVHCPECEEVPVDGHDLPVLLPTNLRDEGEGNPLSRRPEFVACQCPRCGRAARRETDTMDTFIDTAWYYLRCTNPEHPESFCDPAAVARWGPADLYIGGIEIAVPIMLYGSFIAKGLRDSGHIDFPLPCRQLLAHEMVLKGGKKMSKSSQNTVDPEALIDGVGADTVRLLILSLAPPLKKIEWSESRLRGCHRFLLRVWKLGIRHAARARDGATEGGAPGTLESLPRHVHGAIRDVTRDLEKLQLNTCITALIKLFYHLEEGESTHCGHPALHDAFCTFLRLLSPFTPHLCEELWSRMAEPGQLSESEWPSYDPELVARATVSIVVKINSTPVARLDVPTDAGRDEVLAIVYENRTVREQLGEGTVEREIYVPGQIVNLVARQG